MEFKAFSETQKMNYFPKIFPSHSKKREKSLFLQTDQNFPKKKKSPFFNSMRKLMVRKY